LFQKVEFIIIGEDAELYIPPPRAALLFEKTELVIVGDE
jgi:hypothetical protein